MGTYIQQNQVGFIKNSQLRKHIRRICNIIYHTQVTKVPTLLYFCNAEKAFDRVNWDFLKAGLGGCEFGQQFRSWIDLIHSEQEASIGLERFKSKKVCHTQWSLTGLSADSSTI